MKYIFGSIILLSFLIGLFIGSLLHLALLGAVIGILLACLLIDVWRRNRRNSVPQQLQQEMLTKEINKAENSPFLHNLTHGHR